MIEIVPPGVETELHGDREQPGALPLSDYISEVMTLLTKFPNATEVVFEGAKRFRFAARDDYVTLYKTVNDRMVMMLQR